MASLRVRRHTLRRAGSSVVVSMNLKQIVAQLRLCNYKCVDGNYTCEGGELSNNLAFRELERMAAQDEQDACQCTFECKYCEYLLDELNDRTA